MIEFLKSIEKHIPKLLLKPEIWNTLDINYFPPRVERLWMQYDDNHRLFIHVIHPTTQPCLFHKHRWPAAFKILAGGYETGTAYSKDEISSEDAYKLPIIRRTILSPGSYDEMVDTHSMHYVKPLETLSISLMVTGPLYPEAEFRKEAKHDRLQSLTEERKTEIITYLLTRIWPKR